MIFFLTLYLFFKLFKTCSYNFNNSVLLLCSHLIITWQANASLKDISSYIFNTTLDIGICFCSSRTGYCHKLIHSVHWLHMHRFPNRSSFCIDT